VVVVVVVVAAVVATIKVASVITAWIQSSQSGSRHVLNSMIKQETSMLTDSSQTLQWQACETCTIFPTNFADLSHSSPSWALRDARLGAETLD
jgi:hypothetical protein